MDPLLGTLYQAAVRPDLWPSFLKDLARVVNADVITLAAAATDGNQVREMTCNVGNDPKTEADYLDYYQARDPFIEAGVLELPVGAVVPLQSLVPEDELLQTECYHDFYQQNGWQHGFGAKIFEAEEGLVAMLGGHRHRSRGPFDEKEIRVLSRLVPHLRRALRMRKEIETLTVERDAGAQLLERVSMGTILVDNRGHVVRTNRIADEILAANDGLASKPEGLEAATPHETAALRRAIAGASMTSKGKATCSGGELLLTRPSGKHPYLVEVSPLDRNAEIWGARGSLAAILITDGTARVAPNLEALGTFYNLTPAEAELTSLLSQGASLDQAADRRGVSRNTARGQLKRIFAKTGTNRQAELVRMVLQGPAGFVRR